LPISISASGGYHDFATFVSGVSGLPRIVTLHDFEISKNGSSMLNLSITAKTYRYKEPEQ
ncbi:MAG: type 4a pilus biogenesis protein PilO, partial [Pseudomonadales bacterium]